jgi:hypothetical protein
MRAAGLTTSARLLADDAPPAPAGPKEFLEAWSKVVTSNLVAPELPSNYLDTGATGESLADGENFPVNFYTPHGAVAEKQVCIVRTLHHSAFRQ